MVIMGQIIWGVFCVFLAGCAGHKLVWESPYRNLSSVEKGDIVHLPTGMKVTEEQLIDLLSGTRIVYVGEAHDNMKSHEVQLEILKALAKRYPQEIAVGMEMLQQSSQDAADRWTSGDLSEKEFARIWVKNWSNNFPYYRPILQYIREHKIPLVALRASDDSLKTVKEVVSTTQLKDSKQQFPEMDFEDPYHRAHTKAIFDKHPGSIQDFEDFYRVQVLWDESMAEGIADYLSAEEGQDRRMVVFAGSQHIEHGFGIPRRVFRRLPLPYAIVLPIAVHIPPEKRHKLMHVTLPEVPLPSGDFAWIVGYEDLEDQKAYLGVIIQECEGGVKILRIMQGSAADKAGLKKEDIITAFDGKPIETKFDFTYLVDRKKPGDSGTMHVSRNKEHISLEVIFQKGHFHR